MRGGCVEFSPPVGWSKKGDLWLPLKKICGLGNDYD
jgi:hypothetical protein